MNCVIMQIRTYYCRGHIEKKGGKETKREGERLGGGGRERGWGEGGGRERGEGGRERGRGGREGGRERGGGREGEGGRGRERGEGGRERGREGGRGGGREEFGKGVGRERGREEGEGGRSREEGEIERGKEEGTERGEGGRLLLSSHTYLTSPMLSRNLLKRTLGAMLGTLRTNTATDAGQQTAWDN